MKKYDYFLRAMHGVFGALESLQADYHYFMESVNMGRRLRGVLRSCVLPGELRARFRATITRFTGAAIP